MKQYTWVLLETGEKACIVEVLEDEKAYLADVDHKDGSTTTEFIMEKQIEKIID